MNNASSSSSTFRSPRRKSPPPAPSSSASSSSHGRALSGSGLLSRIPFIRSPTESRHQRQSHLDDPPSPPLVAPPIVATPSSAMSSVVQQQQQKTRRRRGSLRKVALLGRGAQRDRRDSSPLVVDTSRDIEQSPAVAVAATSLAGGERDALGLSVSDLTPRPSMDGFASRISLTSSDASSVGASSQPSLHDHERRHQTTYTSTTDEEDLLQIGTAPQRPGIPLSSASDSYFRHVPVIPAHRGGFQQAKSPLSYSGLATTPLPPADTDWDYSETEWWGWVVLTVTWFVFVIGMGSCLDVWSWAWDIGKTPYAPPELEDDPTLPIVGYYPALIILTCVMAWVWVVVAWVGMKYFRHAKISGD